MRCGSYLCMAVLLQSQCWSRRFHGTCCDGIAGIDKGRPYSDVIAVGAVVLIVRGYRGNTASS